MTLDVQSPHNALGKKRQHNVTNKQTKRLSEKDSNSMFNCQKSTKTKINHDSSFCGCSEMVQTWKSCHNHCKAILAAASLICDSGSCAIIDEYLRTYSEIWKIRTPLSCVSPKPKPGWTSFHSLAQGTHGRRRCQRWSCHQGGSGRRSQRRGRWCHAPWTRPCFPWDWHTLQE